MEEAEEKKVGWFRRGVYLSGRLRDALIDVSRS